MLLSFWFVGTGRVGFRTWIWPKRHCRQGRKRFVDFNTVNTQLVWFNCLFNFLWCFWCENGWACPWWKCFKMLGISFSCKSDWSSYVVSSPKAASKKNWALICSANFSSLEVALHLYKFIDGLVLNESYVWGDAPIVTGIGCISYRNRHVGWLVLQLLFLLNP